MPVGITPPPSLSIGFVAPPELVQRVDAYRDRLASEHALRVSRSDALRALVERGLRTSEGAER